MEVSNNEKHKKNPTKDQYITSIKNTILSCLQFIDCKLLLESRIFLQFLTEVRHWLDNIYIYLKSIGLLNES